jgi:hypothetical protein
MWLGQLVYLPRVIGRHADTRRAFAEERLIEQLVKSGQQPDHVGVGLSERVVEIPWVLRRLGEREGRVLDVGTAFSPIVYMRLLVRQPRDVETVDLAPTSIPGLTSHVADVRSLPFVADTFDVAVCISTLEHVGMDNAIYDIPSGGGGDVEALRELGRVASAVLVTVPGGRDEQMGWQQQYSPARFRAVAAAAGLAVERLDVFAHDPLLGWGSAGEDSIGTRVYGVDAVAAAAVLCAQLTRG